MQYKFLDPDKLLSTSDFDFVLAFLKDTGRTQVGWHYVMDLAWIYSQAKNWPTSYRILDAGGGRGPTQFLLAELGFDVTNVDLVMTAPAPRIKKRYGTSLASAASYQETSYIDHLTRNSAKKRSLRKLRGLVHSIGVYQKFTAEKYRKVHEQWRNANGVSDEVGRLTWLRANLCNVPEIESGTFDAVVSLSALEHIPISALPEAWTEISRICKPNAKFAITTSATDQGKSWFHEPSQGNCFSERDLEKIFGAVSAKNNSVASAVLDEYRTCTYLKDHLAGFYFESGENGMPWGKWNPGYIPVGLFKIGGTTNNN